MNSTPKPATKPAGGERPADAYNVELKERDMAYIRRCGPGMTLRGYWAALAAELIGNGETLNATLA